ncbi:hypothetical protein GXW83_04735 [Streptacidiphilus sp. PB12-B1b]|uniref:hypothetical protein n=1 Tax=Streptacidiphilus sp. PB12-B1b TaxID=2705012 RepID=UPI0015FA3CE1|nr:hypothetical protein [Streptacidiphilus sp. PB12-B1b]QMU75168.1 hypothetical protein GXW83_04735 [Streptacidiphilus sp. PB12-B1b]
MPASASPLAEARNRLDALDRAVRLAQRRLGSGLEVRRVRADLDHLRESLALLCESIANGAVPGPATEVVEIPDTPYDPEMWRGIDDEGIGCRHT